MTLFILPENQKLIWDTMNKAPLFADFVAHSNESRDVWFRDIIHKIYEKHRDKTLTIPELRQLNKETISQMLISLKNRTPQLNVTPRPEAFRFKSIDTSRTSSGSAYESANLADSSVGFPINDNKTATRNYMLDQKHEVLNNQFLTRQKEFDDMIHRKPAKEIDFREQTDADRPIENMDELLKKHIRAREYDVEMTQPPTGVVVNASEDNRKSLDGSGPQDVSTSSSSSGQKSVKWAPDIESTSPPPMQIAGTDVFKINSASDSQKSLEYNIFQEFVKKTTQELYALRAEINLLKAQVGDGNRGSAIIDKTLDPLAPNNLLARMRKTVNKNRSDTGSISIAQLGRLEDISDTFQ
jgi:hypothetical protein